MGRTRLIAAVKAGAGAQKPGLLSGPGLLHLTDILNYSRDRSVGKPDGATSVKMVYNGMITYIFLDKSCIFRKMGRKKV
jgi:hypothetical protein